MGNNTTDGIASTTETARSQIRQTIAETSTYSIDVTKSSLPLSILSSSGNKTETPVVVTASQTTQAQGIQEGDAKELSLYDDYNYDWAEDSEVLKVFGDEEKERSLFEDKCIYTSILQLWEENFDFSTITTEEIQDKVTRALDDG